MKVQIAAVVLIPFATIVGLRATVHAQPPTKSVWDGVYTEEQAKRGEPLYSQQCASCHGAELMGGEMAPPLAERRFPVGLGRSHDRRSVRADPHFDAAERARAA